jgi:hypothetical protein
MLARTASHHLEVRCLSRGDGLGVRVPLYDPHVSFVELKHLDPRLALAPKRRRQGLYLLRTALVYYVSFVLSLVTVFPSQIDHEFAALLVLACIQLCDVVFPRPCWRLPWRVSDRQWAIRVDVSVLLGSLGGC